MAQALAVRVCRLISEHTCICAAAGTGGTSGPQIGKAAKPTVSRQQRNLAHR